MIERLRKHREDTPTPRPLFDEEWRIPERFNFARDVVDTGTRKGYRSALTSIDREGTIDRQTYADLARNSVRWANLLWSIVDEPSARIVLAIDSPAIRLTATLGAIRCGLIPVLLPPRIPPAASLELSAEVDAALIVAEHDPRSTESEAAGSGPPAFLSLDDASWGLMRPSRRAHPVESDPVAPAVVVYTRGTSARPRPVVHSHAATASANVALAFWLGVRPGDVVYCGPESAAGAALWNGMLGPLSIGAEIAQIAPELDIDERLRLLQRVAPTIIVQTPAEHLAMLDGLERSGRSLPSLRIAGSTGDPLARALSDRFSCEMGVPLLDAYYTTETGTIIAQTVDGADPVRSLGRAVPGLTLRTATSEGEAIADREPGQLVLEGHPPTLFLGYWPDHWNLRDETENVDLRQEAWWVPTEDRFSMNASGAFWLERVRQQKPRASRTRKPSTADSTTRKRAS